MYGPRWKGSKLAASDRIGNGVKMQKRWLNRIFGVVLAVGGLVTGAYAGQMTEKGYTADRFGQLEVTPPAGKWEMRDQEATGNNHYGGPVVDFLLKQAVQGSYPVVKVSAVKKDDGSVTPDFVLKTSRDTMTQQGGQLSAVETGRVGGRNVWSYQARISIKGQLSQVVYLLLEGPTAFFMAQMVVPDGALAQAKPLFDELLATFRY